MMSDFFVFICLKIQFGSELRYFCFQGIWWARPFDWIIKRLPFLISISAKLCHRVLWFLSCIGFIAIEIERFVGILWDQFINICADAVQLCFDIREESFVAGSVPWFAPILGGLINRYVFNKRFVRIVTGWGTRWQIVFHDFA